MIARAIAGCLEFPSKLPLRALPTPGGSLDSRVAFCARQQAGLIGGASIADPVYFVRGSERFQFNDFVTSKMRSAMQAANPHETQTVSIPPDGWSIQVRNGVLIPFDAIQVIFEMDEQIHQIRISSDRIAELILSGFGEDDIIIFGDQLERRKIDPDTGEIL